MAMAGRVTKRTLASAERPRRSRAGSGAGDRTPVLSAGELLERGLAPRPGRTAERPRASRRTPASAGRSYSSRATSGAGDWTPVLSAGELGAVAGELLERGLGAAAWPDGRAAAVVVERGHRRAAQVEGDVGRW
ncbi:hypothetical protein ACMHYB_38380 [Sorangium sp. So ce1128]